jgi:hypothetical protein
MVGAHYPSDCLLGLVMGTAVVSFGSLLYHADVQLCSECRIDRTALPSPLPTSSPTCYAPNDDSSLSWSNFGNRHAYIHAYMACHRI